MTEGSTGQATFATALVVEDDALLRQRICRVLRRAGYHVWRTESAPRALGWLLSGRRFDAIVCEDDLPGMTGSQFREAISALDPSLSRRFLLVVSSASLRAHDAGPSCLVKPFGSTELLQACARVRRGAADPGE